MGEGSGPRIQVKVEETPSPHSPLFPADLPEPGEAANAFMAPGACLCLMLKPLVFTPVSLLRLQGQTCRQGPDLICVTHWLACRLHTVGELSTFGEPKRHVIIHLFQNNMKESYLLVLMYYPT